MQVAPGSKINPSGQLFPDQPVYKPAEQQVYERPLSEVILKMGETLKDLKEANKVIKFRTKEVNRLDEIMNKERAKITTHPTDERAPKANKFAAKRLKSLGELRELHANTVEQKRKVLQEASQLLKDVAKHNQLHPSNKETAEVKKIKTLVNKINKEIFKQDSDLLNLIDNRLNKITGKNIFSSIFGIKSISKKDIPELHELAVGLQKVKNHLGPQVALYQDKIDRIEVRLGSALLNSHGYKTKREIDRFLETPFNELDRTYPFADLDLMARFIARKYPEKDSSILQGELIKNPLRLAIVELLNAKELTPEEIKQGRLQLQQLETIQSSHPAFEEAQALHFILHRKVYPNYLKAPTGGQSEINQLLKEYETFQFIAQSLEEESKQTNKLSNFEERLKVNNKLLTETKNQLLDNLSILEKYYMLPAFKDAARKAIVEIILATNPNVIRNYRNELSTLKSIPSRSLPLYQEEIAIRSGVLGYFIEDYEKIGLKTDVDELKKLKQQYDNLLNNITPNLLK